MAKFNLKIVQINHRKDAKKFAEPPETNKNN